MTDDERDRLLVENCERTRRIEEAITSGLDDKPGILERLRALEAWRTKFTAILTAIGLTAATLAIQNMWGWFVDLMKVGSEK